jgi:hypothetical protein
MGKSMREQLLAQGAVKPEDTFEAKRAREEAARPPVTEKALPPLFEPKPKGVFVGADTDAAKRKPKQP